MLNKTVLGSYYCLLLSLKFLHVQFHIIGGTYIIIKTALYYHNLYYFMWCYVSDLSNIKIYYQLASACGYCRHFLKVTNKKIVSQKKKLYFLTFQYMSNEVY